MDRIIGKDCIMSITLEETILEKCKITEAKNLEVDIEGIIEMITLEEVEVSPGTDNIWVISTEMTEVVVVGQDQV